MSKIAAENDQEALNRAGWTRGWNSIGARLLILLLVAEAPLVAFTVAVVLQNDRLSASDALARTALSQSDALTQLRADIRAAAAVASSVSSLPHTVLKAGRQCDDVLATLQAATGSRVGAIVVARGTTVICTTAPGTALTQEMLPAEPAQGDQVALFGSAATLFVAHQVVASGADLEDDSGSVFVKVGQRTSPQRGTGDLDRPMLWLHRGAAWLPAGPGASGDIPAETRGPEPDRPPAHLLSRGGETFLYSAFTLPANVGEAGDVLVAGSNIRDAATASQRSFVTRLAELAAFFLGEFLLIASGVSQVASRPLKRLNEAVDRWRAGGMFSMKQDGVRPIEVAELARSFAEATHSLDQREQELRGAVAQQELLMQEIHHRVKNNLQIIASLLNLQAARIKVPEARAEFQSARDRVRTLGTLHRHLYSQGELHRIDMRAFFAELCAQLFLAQGEVEGDRITLTITAEDVQISSDQAVPIALIVTETVGNALKHAFPNGRTGRILLDFELLAATRARLSICDDGIGHAAPEAGEGPASGLGLQLVRGFARQLGAHLTISAEQGTCYRLDMAIVQLRDPELASIRPAMGRA